MQPQMLPSSSSCYYVQCKIPEAVKAQLVQTLVPSEETALKLRGCLLLAAASVQKVRPPLRGHHAPPDDRLPKKKNTTDHPSLKGSFFLFLSVCKTSCYLPVATGIFPSLLTSQDPFLSTPIPTRIMHGDTARSVECHLRVRTPH
jgi:hypothetical protein